MGGTRGKRLAGAIAAGVLLTSAGTVARAGEGPFGWIYTLDLQPEGTWQAQVWNKVQNGQSRGNFTYMQPRFELEYGVTNWYQVGVYLNGAIVNAHNNCPDGTTCGPGTFMGPYDDPYKRYARGRIDSVSTEHIIRLLNPVTDPIGLGIYFEPTIGPKMWEMETKLLIQKNLLDDTLILAANIVYSIGRKVGGFGDVASRDQEVDLVAGASYRFFDNWFFGAEVRNHNEFGGWQFLRHREHSAWFAGPTVHYANERFWLTAAWRHQLPVAHGFNEEQRDVIVGGRIFGNEHARDEFMFRMGIPFSTR